MACAGHSLEGGTLGWGKMKTFGERVLLAVPDVPGGTSGTTGGLLAVPDVPGEKSGTTWGNVER